MGCIRECGRLPTGIGPAPMGEGPRRAMLAGLTARLGG